MGTEKFMAFKEDGTAYRLKGRILRFLDAEPVSSADKSNMRSSLGITSQGGLGDLLAANNLDDVGSKDTAKTNLEIPDIGLQANQVPLSGMLNSGAWLDFDAFYSEGTWTPTLKLGGSEVSHSSQSAVFTKVGNIVTYSGVVILSSLDALTGTVTIDGLPYAAKNTSAGQSAVTVGYAANMASLTSVPTGFVGNNESKIYFYHFGSTGAVDLSHTNLTATSQIRFSGTYQIA